MSEPKTHVFTGEPDARQSADPIRPSRFRPAYRPLTPEEIALHNAIKAKATELEGLIAQAGDQNGLSIRYQALALTSLEQAVMWAVKGLTA